MELLLPTVSHLPGLRLHILGMRKLSGLSIFPTCHAGEGAGCSGDAEGSKAWHSTHSRVSSLAQHRQDKRPYRGQRGMSLVPGASEWPA